MKLQIEHEFTREEKEEFINSMDVDEIFDIIKSNTGKWVKGFHIDDIIYRVLDDYPEYLISAKKVDAIIEQLPDKDNCKTVVEALAVQELNNLY